MSVHSRQHKPSSRHSVDRRPALFQTTPLVEPIGFNLGSESLPNWTAFAADIDRVSICRQCLQCHARKQAGTAPHHHPRCGRNKGASPHDPPVQGNVAGACGRSTAGPANPRRQPRARRRHRTGVPLAGTAGAGTASCRGGRGQRFCRRAQPTGHGVRQEGA